MSNGSEWVRELPTPKPDYEALIAEVKGLFAEGWCVCRSSHLPGDLLDAVEALVAENTRLRTNMGVMSKLNSTLEDERDLARIERDRTEAERDALRARSKRLRQNRMKERASLVARINDYRAERDALRTQLDSMHERDEVGVQVGSWPPTTYQDLGLALYYAAHPFKGYEEYEHKVVTRRTLTGPWTVVEGDDQ